MTLLLLDSFNHYTSANRSTKWAVGSGTSVDHTPPSIPFRQGYGIGLDDFSNFWRYQYVSSSYDNPTVYLGTAFYYNRVDGVTQFQFLRGLTGQVSLELHYFTDKIEVWRGGAGVASASVSYVLPRMTWVYIEIAIFCHATAGWAIVKFDGVEVVNVTGINTKNVLTADTTINGCTIGGANIFYDDFYLANGAGSQTFLNPIYIHAIAPRGAAAVQQSTPTSQTSRVANVQGTPPQYPGCWAFSISSNVNTINGTQEDRFVFHPLTLPSGVVRAVQVVNGCSGTSGNVNAVLYQPSTAGLTLSASGAVTPTRKYRTFAHELNPNTGLAWTLAEVNEIQAGYKGSSAVNIDFSHCVLEVAVSAAGGSVPDYMPAEPLYMIA